MTSSREVPKGATLRRYGSSRLNVLFGASIGAGSAAHAVQQGGADFLLVANVGRLRIMGAPSCACHLPIRDCNDLVMSFAPSEILSMAGTLPVFLGVAACDPRLDLQEHLRTIREWGFDGVSNFPTFSQMTGPYRQALEASGLGFCREIEMLAEAKAQGLSVLGYGGGPSEIAQLAELRADIICVQFDPQLALTPESSLADLEVAASLARPLVSHIRKSSPTTLCLCGGAAIASPERMFHLTKLMNADGYIGGSTIDQLPLETSIEDKVAEFKSVAALWRRAQEEERASKSLDRSVKLTSQLSEVRRLFARIARAARKDCDLTITGESGAGKSTVAVAAYHLSRRRSRPLARLHCDPSQGEALDVQLFGALAGANGSARGRIGLLDGMNGGTLLVEGLERMPISVQSQLLRAMEEKRYRIVGDSRDRAIDVRFIFTSRVSLPDLLASGLLLHELYLRLSPFAFELPPLRDRVEDLPVIVERLLEKISQKLNPKIEGIEHAAIRYLQAQPWTGNIRDLAAALEAAATTTQDTRLQLSDFQRSAPAPKRPASEKEWVTEALRRHKFRKGATADFLGISRKTLYNKLKQYGIQ